jgi:hypothetical protein
MLTEAKHFKEQTEEIRRWEDLRDEKVSHAVRRPAKPG